MAQQVAQAQQKAQAALQSFQEQMQEQLEGTCCFPLCNPKAPAGAELLKTLTGFFLLLVEIYSNQPKA